MKSLAFLFCLVSISAIGCGQTESVESPLIDIQNTDHVTLCKDCGQVKGSELCCSEEGEACDCGFHQGSPACCKLEKGDEDMKLCGKCGQVAGCDECCSEGAETCECGLQKGSPGCCKINQDSPAADDGSGDGDDEDSSN